VLGLNADRDLIRSVARRLAEDGADSARIRAAIGRTKIDHVSGVNSRLMRLIASLKVVASPAAQAYMASPFQLRGSGYLAIMDSNPTFIVGQSA
jgi:hypothetical protein